MYDLVIEGGTIVDGSGAASFIGSVYIQSGRIASTQAEDNADAQYLKRMLARVEGMPMESLDAGVPWVRWQSFSEYLCCLDNTLAVNAGFLVGHSALRRTVMGERANSEAADATDLENMKALLRESLGAGGLGFSSTLSPTHNDMEGKPVPSRFASHTELRELAGVRSEFPGTVLEFLPGTKQFDKDT